MIDCVRLHHIERTAVRSAHAAGGPAAYVVNANSGTVSVIDTSTNTVTATIGVVSFPFWVAVNPDGSAAYVTRSLPPCRWR